MTSVTMLLSSHAIPQSLCFARGVVQYATGRGPWRLTYQPIQLLRTRQNLSTYDVDGYIAELQTPQDVEAARRLGKPLVCLYDLVEKHPFPEVVLDEERVGRLGAERLLRLGFRRFAYLGIPTRWSQGREHGFRTAVEAAGFACPVHFPGHRSADPKWWKVRNGRYLRAWVAHLTPPHAVMACDSEIAARLIEVCLEAGLRVPADVAVLGVDNDELMCDFARVSITAVDTDWSRMGYEAARVLDLMLHGKTAPRRVVVPPRAIIERHSTDTVPVDDAVLAAALRHIRENLAEPIGVTQLVEQTDVSRRTLELKFRHQLGLLPGEAILHARLARAADLLVDTDASLYEIAEQCGLADRSHLSHAFTKVFGTSPSKYRDQHRKLTIY